MRPVASLTAWIALSIVRDEVVRARAVLRTTNNVSEGGTDADEEEGRTEGIEEGREEDDEEKGLEEVARHVRAASLEAAPRAAAR